MLSGRAMYIWDLGETLKAVNGGTVAALVGQAQKAKITSLWAKIGDGTAPYANIAANAATMKSLVQACQAANISVLGYHVPHCATTQAAQNEAAFVTQAASDFALAGVVVDNEDGASYFQGNAQAADVYGSGLQKAMTAAGKLVLMSSNDIISAHPKSYATVIGKYINLNAPQVYYGQSPSVQNRLDRAMNENSVIAAPFFPVGAAFLSSGSDGGCSDGAACAQQASQFIGLVSALNQTNPKKYPGYGFWDWQEAPDEFWQVLYSTPVFVQPSTLVAGLATQGSSGS